MKTHPQLLVEMSDLEQSSVEGGNLAYDVGRTIRFLFISMTEGCGGVPGTGVGPAIIDWEMHAA
jgi:hypothetical protein